MYLCHASWRNEKRHRPENRYTYSHGPYLKRGFWFFRKKLPWGTLASKNCRVTWIFRKHLRLPCQNPLEASSRSKIFLISLVYVCFCVCIYVIVSRLLATLTTIQTWNLAHILLRLTLCKKRVFCFFNQIPVTAASLEKTAVSRWFSAYLLDCLVFGFPPDRYAHVVVKIGYLKLTSTDHDDLNVMKRGRR